MTRSVLRTRGIGGNDGNRAAYFIAVKCVLNLTNLFQDNPILRHAPVLAAGYASSQDPLLQTFGHGPQLLPYFGANTTSYPYSSRLTGNGFSVPAEQVNGGALLQSLFPGDPFRSGQQAGGSAVNAILGSLIASPYENKETSIEAVLAAAGVDQNTIAAVLKDGGAALPEPYRSLLKKYTKAMPAPLPTKTFPGPFVKMGTGGGKFNEKAVQQYFSPTTRRQVFKPLISCFNGLFINFYSKDQKFTEWLRIVKHHGNHESIPLIKCMMELYIAAARGDVGNIFSAMNRLEKDGFLRGKPAKAIPRAYPGIDVWAWTVRIAAERMKQMLSGHDPDAGDALFDGGAHRFPPPGTAEHLPFHSVVKKMCDAFGVNTLPEIDPDASDSDSGEDSSSGSDSDSTS
eukprot:Blabericola_migrator_1__3584@NODE_2066_length_3334_cov_9_894399_g1309_i0_p2_GENE_NODE_2066_length_3334_cov_9_894399_g1309_i0NODE_2066_length_3334_cov_9_894399_g1309_i0_p2_ORF_typecomplete_len400_score34_58_NODE_2066_length_3334_cov_9_894399_g1309_i0641263